MQKKEIINSIKIVVLALILTGAIGYAWTGPAEDPPAGNVDRPINVGASDQDKVGGLSLGGLLVAGGAYFNGDVFIASGNPSAGKVLTAVDGTGLVKWESSAGAGSVIKEIRSGVKMIPINGHAITKVVNFAEEGYEPLENGNYVLMLTPHRTADLIQFDAYISYESKTGTGFVISIRDSAGRSYNTTVPVEWLVIVK